MTRTPPRVYTSEPVLRTPRALLALIVRDIRASRELSWSFFRRDLSAQYRQSLLGPFWTFVAPLVTSLIFIVLQSRNVVNFGEFDVPYPVYVVVGTILWQVFVESLNAPLRSVAAAKPLLAKIYFPRESLVFAAVYLVLYGLLIKLAVLLVLLLLLGVSPGWGMILAIGPILTLVLCGLCLGLLITPLGMLYADVAAAMPIVTQLLFFVTPVVYNPPVAFPFSLVGTLNPVSPPLMVARELITKGSTHNLGPLGLVMALTAVAAVVAVVVYRVSLPIFIERTSS